MDIRTHQAPLKERYREDPAAARITLTARGTLGLDRETTPGFTEIRTRFEVDAPEATEEQLDSLLRKTERYCTVLQTLTGDPSMPVELHRAAG